MSLLTGNANCIKYLLFGFNIIFMLTGIILIAVGVSVTAVYAEYDAILAHKFFSIPTFLIVIGSFIIIITFFGCWGALKENYCLVLSFSVLLAIIFILELSAGISGYVLRSDAEKILAQSLGEALKTYEVNSTNPGEQTKMWDNIQNNFHCCGVYNATEWGELKHGQELPISCCEIKSGAYGKLGCFLDGPHKENGCLSGFSTYIEQHAVSLGAAGIVIAIIQFFGVFFACYIAREIKIRNGITGFM